MRTNDTMIISLLRDNSRISLTRMSKITKIPISTLYERLKNFNKGLIRKHTALVDFAQLGFSARARVLLKVPKEELQNLRTSLISCPALNELYKINNGYDFMAEFIFATMKDLEEYLDKLGEQFSLEKEEVFYIIDELRREEFLSKAQIWMLGERGK